MSKGEDQSLLYFCVLQLLLFAHSSMAAVHHLLLFLVVVSAFPFPFHRSQQAQESQTLLSIKSAWGNPPALASWTAKTHLCNWAGIQCGNGSIVTGITLPDAGISDPIPPSICHLKDLTHLDLSYNNIPGQFPTSLYSCSNLKYLDISQNLFVGAIPLDVSSMSPALQYLILSANNFSGDVPPTIGRFPSLRWLLLDNNLFNGSFPAEIGGLSNLEFLWLAYNPFSPAAIPPALGSLKKLKFLWMTKTNLMGEIPDTLRQLTELVQLDLGWNSLTGEIPGWIWNLKKLKNLFLYANKFTGEISSSTVGALGLVSIDVSINGITGSIPEDFGKLQKLQGLAMYYNRFSGEIPASIGRIPALTDIRLFGNNFTGVLPPELGTFSKLSNIDVDDNMLTGEIPDGLCSGGALKSLVASNNKLTGKLPASLNDCPLLDNIQIFNNQLSGELPAGIWSALNLTTAMINRNFLSGQLPKRLPSNLSRLEIGDNQFSGNIPSVAENLRVFVASNNRFSGELPASFSGMSQLQVLSLGGNQITGSIPAGIEMLNYLTGLDLGGNKLAGEIPPAVGSLPVLTTLDLSRNQLTGFIPQEIGQLKLNKLNLSSNQLTGEVPESLSNQAYSGSFIRNPGLCSPTRLLDIQLCKPEATGSRKSSQLLLIFLLVLSAVFLAAVRFGFFALRGLRRRNRLAPWKLTSFHARRLPEVEIVRGLKQENLIGAGGAGLVYRVEFQNGESVAVKKINSRKLDTKLEEQLEAEVRILGEIRHANIVKLLCCISSSDAKLLVYEYMPNGSLDQWLHRKKTSTPPRPVLDWATRLRIAVGAAQGLCYMHEQCSPAIVHRDVKSSNILLDAEFTARITDFGVALMLVKAGEPESVSAIAGSFGYMAPECAYSKRVTEKMDIYSFGVVMLELVTGREAGDAGGDGDGNLVEWAWRRATEGEGVMEAVDEEMRRDEGSIEEMEAVFTLGLVCTNTLPSARPTMKEVLQVLLRCNGATVYAPRRRRPEYNTIPLLQIK